MTLGEFRRKFAELSDNVEIAAFSHGVESFVYFDIEESEEFDGILITTEN